MVGIMGGGGRTGAWIPARRNWVVGVMGGHALDFREAHLGPGVTEVNVLAIMGGVEILVPPDVRVECSGIGIMGGFDVKHSVTSTTDPGSQRSTYSRSWEAPASRCDTPARRLVTPASD